MSTENPTPTDPTTHDRLRALDDALQAEKVYLHWDQIKRIAIAAAHPAPVLDVEALAVALHREEMCWPTVHGCGGPVHHPEAKRIAAAYQTALAARGVPPTLDSAWAEVERLLPEGWFPQVEKYTPKTYRAWVIDQTGEHVLPCTVGPTPTEALTNLAAALAARTEGR